MATKFAAALAIAAVVAAVPAASFAGGDIQQYPASAATYQQQTYSSYAPAPAPYMRPSGMYYGSYCSPCATMPYGYGYGQGYGYGGGGLFGNPVFTAGVLGLGLGYLIWH